MREKDFWEYEKSKKTFFNYILHNIVCIATKPFQLKLDIVFLYVSLKTLI